MSSNKVASLPVSFQTLSLDHIDVFGNPFEVQQEKPRLGSLASMRTVGSLLALSAKSVITFRSQNSLIQVLILKLYGISRKMIICLHLSVIFTINHS